jgi:DNA-binding CsgD family transcriptional regulator
VRHILYRYWSNHPSEKIRLPHEIRKWLTDDRTRVGVRHRVVQEPAPPLVIHRPAGRLVVRAMYDDTCTALLFEESVLDIPADCLASLGLAPREVEVLRWLTQGKSIPEIAAILNNSPRTVSKLLTRVYRQLGVENRHAAVATVLEVVQAYHPSPAPRQILTPNEM